MSLESSGYARRLRLRAGTPRQRLPRGSQRALRGRTRGRRVTAAGRARAPERTRGESTARTTPQGRRGHTPRQPSSWPLYEPTGPAVSVRLCLGERLLERASRTGVYVTTITGLTNGTSGDRTRTLAPRARFTVTRKFPPTPVRR